MSGGSFNYLYSKDVSELMNSMDDLVAMRDQLAKVGYAQDAARETDELICMINQFQVLIGVRMDRLRSTWQAMEWWKSYDIGEEGFQDSLNDYRGNIPKKQEVAK